MKSIEKTMRIEAHQAVDGIVRVPSSLFLFLIRAHSSLFVDSYCMVTA